MRQLAANGNQGVARRFLFWLPFGACEKACRDRQANLVITYSQNLTEQATGLEPASQLSRRIPQCQLASQAFLRSKPHCGPRSDPRCAAQNVARRTSSRCLPNEREDLSIWAGRPQEVVWRPQKQKRRAALCRGPALSRRTSQGGPGGTRTPWRRAAPHRHGEYAGSTESRQAQWLVARRAPGYLGSRPHDGRCPRGSRAPRAVTSYSR